jgi:hypothetical protein
MILAEAPGKNACLRLAAGVVLAAAALVGGPAAAETADVAVLRALD